MSYRITLLISCFSLLLQAQSYKPFLDPNDTLSFVDANELVRFVYFDSIVNIMDGEVYHPAPELGFNSNPADSCYGHLYDTAWTGYHIEQQTDSLIFRHSSFTLSFNPNKLDTSAVIPAGQYDYGNDHYDFLITYLGTNWQLTHTGQHDSVRIFELVVKKSNGNNVSSVDPITIELSKNHGIQSLPLLTSIGDPQGWSPNLTRLEYEVLTVGEVYDFEVGDEFQYKMDYYGTGSKPTTYSTLEVINKSTFSDSIKYTFARTYNDYDVDQASQTITQLVYRDTIARTYHNLDKLLLDKLTNSPSSTIVSWYEDMYWGRPGVKTETGHFTILSDDCLVLPFEPKIFESHYARGLGEIYYFKNVVDMTQTIYQRKLIYYKRANGTSDGSKVNIGLDEFEGVLSSFYPNPVADKLYFDLRMGQEIQLQIYDTSGQLKLSGTVSVQNPTINVSDLSAGVYVLRHGNASAKLVKL